MTGRAEQGNQDLQVTLRRVVAKSHLLWSDHVPWMNMCTTLSPVLPHLWLILSVIWDNFHCSQIKRVTSQYHLSKSISANVDTSGERPTLHCSVRLKSHFTQSPFTLQVDRLGFPAKIAPFKKKKILKAVSLLNCTFSFFFSGMAAEAGDTFEDHKSLHLNAVLSVTPHLITQSFMLYSLLWTSLWDIHSLLFL